MTVQVAAAFGRVATLFSDCDLQWSAVHRDAAAQHIAEVIVCLAAIAQCAGEKSLGECIADKMKKTAAKYPVHLVKGKADKYTAYVHCIERAKVTGQLMISCAVAVTMFFIAMSSGGSGSGSGGGVI